MIFLDRNVCFMSLLKSNDIMLVLLQNCACILRITGIIAHLYTGINKVEKIENNTQEQFLNQFCAFNYIKKRILDDEGRKIREVGSKKKVRFSPPS